MGSKHVNTDRAKVQDNIDQYREQIILWYMNDLFSVVDIHTKLITLGVNAAVGQIQYAMHRYGLSRPRVTNSPKLKRSASKRVYSKRKCQHCNEEYQPSASIQIYCQTCAPSSTWWRRIKLFGINKPAFDAMMKSQNGKCGICQCELTSSARVDHNHITMKVRGLLCGRCNLEP